MPSTVNVGPPILGLSVTTAVPLSPLTLHVLSLYADAIASNLKDDVNETDTNALKMKLATLIEDEGGSWESTNGALQICRETSEKDLVSKVMDIVVSHGHVVPEDVQSWSSRIMAIAKDMSSEGVAVLKNQCSPSVWAALVFSNIRPTPARVLRNETVGKTKISDWDLFPSPMVKPCGNCERKSHPCMVQSSGVTKCRECALFQLSCPKGGPRGRPRRASSTDTSGQTSSATVLALRNSTTNKRKHCDCSVDLDNYKTELVSLRNTIDDTASAVKKLRQEYRDAVTSLHTYTTTFMQG